MTNIWFFIVPCLVVAYIGTLIKKPDAQVFEDWKFPWGPSTPCRMPGKLMFLAGTIGAIIGIYAAFKGPVQLGGLTLPQSPYLTSKISAAREKKASMKDKYSRKEKVKKEKTWASPMEYAKAKVSVTGGWHMKGKTGRHYKGCVHNRGDKTLRSVQFVLKGKNENKVLGVGEVAAFSSVDYSFDLGLHFWRQYQSGPILNNAVFK